MLFLLYINDLPECLTNTRPRLFADDTNLTASRNSIADIEIAVNSELENLRNWLTANKLSLNVAKTEFMLIGFPQMIRNVSNSQPVNLIENKQIKQVNVSKTVGTTIDHHLTWKPNTENICKKITSGISALRRVKPFITERNTLISIYNALVHPYFNYCSKVWDTFRGVTPGGVRHPPNVCKRNFVGQLVKNTWYLSGNAILQSYLSCLLSVDKLL